MKSVHLVICDLFLPADLAGDVCAGLRLPALEKILSRSMLRDVPPPNGHVTGSGQAEGSFSLETLLCEIFGVRHLHGDAPIAPISASFDGLAEGCWLRADPVHLRLQRDQMILLPDIRVGAEEAGQLCAALNEHFSGQGMEFFAPHPQRWYVRLGRMPDIETVPLSQAAGRNVHGLLPKGAEALHWHGLFNEIQMLLFSHPVNEAREARSELPINSVWFWGGGCTADVAVQKNFDQVSSDEELPGMFSSSAGVPFSGWPAQWNDTLSLAASRRERVSCSEGGQLLVWTGLRSALRGGDLEAWRAALQEFEAGYAQPLLKALRAGRIAQLQLDILGGERPLRLLLNRSGAWVFWRRSRPLAAWSRV